MTAEPGSEGLFASIKQLAATLVAMGRTRLALLGNEIAVEKQRVLRLLVISQAMLFFLALGSFLAVMFFVLLFWDHRLVILGVLTVFALGIAGTLYAAFARHVRSPEKVFADSLAELEADLERLKSASGHAQVPR